MTTVDDSNDLENQKMILQAVQVLLERIFPLLIQQLLTQGKLDKERLNDLDYVRSIVFENSDLIESLKIGYIIDEDFINSAHEAIEADRKSVAIVLVATAIEHKLNAFYRSVLETYFGLSNKETTEAIRSSFHTKLGWLMTLVSGSPISEELNKKIKKVIELRNGFVHYKVTSYSQDDFDSENTGYDRLLQEVKRIGTENILELPNTLETFLREVEFEMDPNYKLAIAATEKMSEEFQSKTSAKKFDNE